MAAPDMWQDRVWVTITKDGAADVNFCSTTQDISIGGGEGGVDIINVNCGQILKLGRPEVYEIGFDNVYPLDIDLRAYKEGYTSGAVNVTAGVARNKFRVALLWTDLTASSVTSACMAISGSYARRVIFKDCYMNGLEEKWTDMVLNNNAKFQVPAVDKTFSGNVKWQYCGPTGVATASISALTSYSAGFFG